MRGAPVSVVAECVESAAEQFTAPALSNTHPSPSFTSEPHPFSTEAALAVSPPLLAPVGAVQFAPPEAQQAIPLPSFDAPPGHEHLFSDLVQRLVAGGQVPPAIGDEVLQIDAAGDQLARVTAGLTLLRAWEATVNSQPEPPPGEFVLDPTLIDPTLKPSPVRAQLIPALLGSHLPDSQAYLMSSFKYGFSLQIDESRFPFEAADFSQPRCVGEPLDEGAAAIQATTDGDVAAGRTWVPPTDFECIVSKHFPHPKSDGGFRNIHHLSSTDGVVPSVNARIDPSLCTLQYQDARHHRGNVLALADAGYLPRQSKNDMASAYKLLAITPKQWRYLAFKDSLGRLCVDTRLAFGLSPACRIFSAFGLIVAWILFWIFHILCTNYVDDYLYVSQNAELAKLEVELAETLMRLLGCAVKDSNTEVGELRMVGLGILFDSHARTVGLPETKRAATAIMVDDFLRRQYATAGELATLSGNLSWAAQVIPGGSTFQNRIFALQAAADRYRPGGRAGRVALSEPVRADLLVWRWLLANANESMPMRRPPIDHESWTDASGTRVGGTFAGSVWQMRRDDPRISHLQGCIAEAEMFAVALQSALYGPGWRGFHLVFYIDNQSDSFSLKSGHARQPRTAHWLRVTTLLSWIFGFSFETVWIASAKNPIADAVTRQDMTSFLLSHPGYHAVPDCDLPMLPTPEAGVGWEAKLIAALDVSRH